MDEIIEEKKTQVSTVHDTIEQIEQEIMKDKEKLLSGEIFKNINHGEDALEEITGALSTISTIKGELNGLLSFLETQKGLDWKE